MSEIGGVLSSANGVMIFAMAIIGAMLFLVLARLGFFSFKGKGLSVGRTESELRAVLMRQKEFILQYYSYSAEMIVADASKLGSTVDFISVGYVIEKVVDEWLSWIFINNVSDDDSYVQMKIRQSELVIFRALGQVDSALLEIEELKDYLRKFCERTTKEVINGLLGIYRIEKSGK